jgi:hypothetical protein
MSTGTNKKFLSNIRAGFKIKRYNDLVLHFQSTGNTTVKYMDVELSNGRRYRRVDPLGAETLLYNFGAGYVPTLQWNGSIYTTISDPYSLVGVDWLDVRVRRGTTDSAVNDNASESIRVFIDQRCTTKQTVELLAYDRLGSWLPFNFDGALDVNIEVQRLMGAKKYGVRGSGGSFEYLSTAREIGADNIDYSKAFIVHSVYEDLITSQFMEILLSSPVVLCRIDGGAYFRVSIQDTTKQIFQVHQKQRIYSYTITPSIQDDINI